MAVRPCADVLSLSLSLSLSLHLSARAQDAMSRALVVDGFAHQCAAGQRAFVRAKFDNDVPDTQPFFEHDVFAVRSRLCDCPPPAAAHCPPALRLYIALFMQC